MPLYAGEGGDSGSSPFSHLIRNVILVRVRIRGLMLGFRVRVRVRCEKWTRPGVSAIQPCQNKRRHQRLENGPGN